MFSILKSNDRTKCSNYYKSYKTCVIQTVSKDIDKCNNMQEQFVNCLLNCNISKANKNSEIK